MFRRRSRGLTGLEIALALTGVAVVLLSALELIRRRRAKGGHIVDAKKIVQRLLEEPWKGNWDVIEESVTSDYIGYDPALPEAIRGPDGIKANFQQYIDAFAGAHIRVDQQIAEGDMVATRWTAQGTHTGELNGIAPTGKEVTVSGLTISRLEGDKIVEEWANWDTLGMLVQLGAVPAPAQAT